MTSEFAVELRDVVKKFITPEGNELSAVDHVTMQIKNGEFFSMLGSSGCGKTTSLRMIAGFEAALEGKSAKEKFSFVVEPAEGYGEWDQALLFPIPRQHFGDCANHGIARAGGRFLVGV